MSDDPERSCSLCGYIVTAGEEICPNCGGSIFTTITEPGRLSRDYLIGQRDILLRDREDLREHVPTFDAANERKAARKHELARNASRFDDAGHDPRQIAVMLIAVANAFEGDPDFRKRPYTERYVGELIELGRQLGPVGTIR